MLKNTANQRVLVYVQDSAGDPLTGQAANLSVYVSLDNETPVAGTGTWAERSAANMPGWYLYGPKTSETDGDHVGFDFQCSTPGAKASAYVVDTVPPALYLLHEAVVLAAVIASPSPTVSAFGIDVAKADGFFDSGGALFIDGPLAGQFRPVSTNIAATINLADPLTTAPTVGNQVALLGYSGA